MVKAQNLNISKVFLEPSILTWLYPKARRKRNVEGDPDDRTAATKTPVAESVIQGESERRQWQMEADLLYLNLMQLCTIMYPNRVGEARNIPDTYHDKYF